MSPVSPHRVEPRLRPVAPLLMTGLALLCLQAGGPAAAPRQDQAFRGQVPKAPPYVDGFPITFHRPADYRPREGAVVPADLDRDGRVELVVSVPAGLVTALRADGRPFAGWPRWFSDASELPQPAYPVGAPGAGDLDGGAPEIVLCVVAGSQPRQNHLFALRADGSTLWTRLLEASDGGGDYYACSPTRTLLADLDGDGAKEVVRSMSGGEVQALDGDGSRMPGWWPFKAGPISPDGPDRARSINTDLTAADLDLDGRDEVILVESGLAPRLFAVEGLGRVLAGFPRQLPQVVDRQAPAVANLDDEGGPEIVQATSPFAGEILSGTGEPSAGEPAEPAALYVLNADGSSRNGWPGHLDFGGPWGAVLADLSGDGLPDIVQNDGDLVLGYDAWGAALPGFPIAVHRDFQKSQSVEISPWVVGDVDGDSRPDLVQVRSHLDSGASYLRVFGLRATGQPLRGFPFDARGLMAASRPVLVDLSGDAVPDLVLLTTAGTNGWFTLVAWDLGALARRAR